MNDSGSGTFKLSTPQIAGRQFVIGFVVLLVSTTVAFSTAYLESAKLIEIERTIDRIYDYVGELRSTVSIFKDVEARVQDYVINGEPRALDSYRSAAAAASQRLQHLKTLASGDSVRENSIAALEQKLFVFLNESQQLVQTRAHHGFESSLIRARDYGMEDIRQQVEDFEEREIALLQSHMRNSQKATANLNALFVALGVLIAIVFCAFVHRLQCHLADRRQAFNKIEKLNAELIDQVRKLETANAEIKLARDQALEANKLKSEFLMNISHELRTPLCAVIGLSDYVSGNALDEDSRQAVALIHESGQALLRQIDDLLEFSCLESGNAQLHNGAFSLRSVASEVVAALSAEASAKGLPVNLTVDGAVPQLVTGDERRMWRAMFHLAHNAVKFTQCGSVDVKVAMAGSDGHSILVRYSVTDTGIGMSEETLHRLFQQFVQADGSTTRKFGGVGLGLSLSKAIITLMGGQITVSSQEGRGSEFFFVVPFDVVQSMSMRNNETPVQKG
jgi:signal transduction histidine kinase